MKYAGAFLLSSQGRNRVESKTKRQLKPKKPLKAGFSHKKLKGEEGTNGDRKKILVCFKPGSSHHSTREYRIWGSVGVIRGWGMGRSKERGRPLWLLEMSVWVLSFFSPSPIPHKEKAGFFFFFSFVFYLYRTLVLDPGLPAGTDVGRDTWIRRGPI